MIRCSLASELTCPRCQRRQGAALDLESFRGLAICARLECRQHFWAMWLRPGAIEPQLAAVFGNALARENMLAWGLPATLDRPTFWQLSLSRRQYELHAQQGSQPMLRALLDLSKDVKIAGIRAIA